MAVEQSEIRLMRGAGVGKRIQPARFKSAAANDTNVGRRFLFVTAPFGPFSRQLADALRATGATCERVIVNGGDLYDWGFADAVFYRGSRDAFSAWFETEAARRGVTDVVTHGDSNPYAAAAIGAARKFGARTHIFEQGYLRPHWITLETTGVNASSCFLLDRVDTEAEPSQTPCVEIGRTAHVAVRQISVYHFWAALLFPLFPKYRSPYLYPPMLQAAGHIVQYFSQRIGRRKNSQRLAEFLKRAGPLYLLLLQRPGDSQLVRHARGAGCGETTLQKVVSSFAAHAPAGAKLIVKAHPLDHGLEPHRRRLSQAARMCGVEDRVLLTYGGDLNQLLGMCTAAVTVNSTAGLTAIESGVPTLALGAAIYDAPGLTHQDGLDALWRSPQAPDPRLFRSFRAALLHQTQINGHFATREGRRLAVPAVCAKMLRSGVDATVAAREVASTVVAFSG